MKRITKYRRSLHQIPELSLQEFKTKAFIEEILSSLNMEIIPVLETGIIGYINVGASDAIAFRSDMDALPIQEISDHEFVSQHAGVMHACGHDGHMAMLLEFAHYVSEHRHRFKKNIVLLFQPAEETIGGARLIVESKILETLQVKAIFGIHLFPHLEQGKIGSRSGEFMSQASEINIIFKGKSAHGAMPQNGVDANMAAASFLVDAQLMLNREISPLERRVLTFGKMYGGDVRNIVSEECVLEGTLRVFKKELYDKILTRLYEIAKGYELVHRVSVEIEVKAGYPAVVNHKELYDQFREATCSLEYEEFENPFMIAEDFSFYQEKFPGVFFFVGTQTETHQVALHNACFNFSEEALEMGVQAYQAIIEKIGG